MTAVLHLDPVGGLVRGVRAAVLTVPAVGAAALAHGSAGGCTSVVGLGLAAGIAWPAGVALLGRPRCLAPIVLWLGLVQAITHVLLEQLCADVMGGHTGVLQHLTAGLTPGMFALHGGSVLLTAVVLGRADAGLWVARALIRTGAWLLRIVSGLPRYVVVITSRPALPLPVAPLLKDLWKAPHPVRRGPPALLAR